MSVTLDLIGVLQMNIQLLGQDSMEKILLAALSEHGCHVEKGVYLKSFQQFDDRVVATIVAQGKEEIGETASFDWMVGTDGARGVVRKMLKLSFLGETRTIENLVVGDLLVHGLSREVGFISTYELVCWTATGWCSIGICGGIRLAACTFAFTPRLSFPFVD